MMKSQKDQKPSARSEMSMVTVGKASKTCDGAKAGRCPSRLREGVQWRGGEGVRWHGETGWTRHIAAEHERDQGLADEQALEPALKHCALLPVEIALDLFQSRLQLGTHLGIRAAGQLRLLDDLLSLKVDHLGRVEQVL